MILVVGLGNPGNQYENTRHNVGFLTVDILAKKLNSSVKKLKFKSLYGETRLNTEKLILIKPQTFMNNSGESVREWVNFYKVPPENLIVIQDDIDIPFATLRLRQKGSAGTHNGMKSIIYQIQKDNFPRVKIGVGQKNGQMDLADFVLSGFVKEEQKAIEEAILLAADAVLDIVKNGIEHAMNRYNMRKKSSL
ncbi:aminoacyl-tRNA hydrolase [Peptostreptococcaceae bacterium oral taxon 113 str. W5053]|nr:aminoacyl-tRNA hydrolase [Peptostreptococcaceae bacterium oral taxon 113 str. W5053]